MKDIAETIGQVDLHLDGEEAQAVAASIAARWLTEGPNAKRFTAEIAAKLRVPHAFLAPNGTLGLYLALLSLDLPPGGEIIMPSFTFFGSASSAVFAGLKPVFIDVDPGTFNAIPEAFERAITPRTCALMPVHIYGQCGDMAAIMSIARARGLKVVEDAAQAFGVFHNGKPAGTFGDIGVYSFFSDKVITTGEGGCLVTSDTEIAQRIALVRNQGRPNSGTFVHPALGMNFRLTDLQAGIGLAQLRKMPDIERDRARKWALYMERLSGAGDLKFMEITKGSSLIPFRFPIRTRHKEELSARLEASGIQTRGFFYPMHLQPRLRTEPPLSLPVSETLNSEGLCLPIHWHIGDAQVLRITGVIRSYFGLTD